MRARVGLVQINNSFSKQDYLPYSVGTLQAYAQRHLKHPEAYEFLLPIYRRLPIKEAVSQLAGASVVFFSTYVWNFRISLEIARTIKKDAPETLIVFGGPQVPERAEAFLRRYPFIDIACHGEGEQIFLAILENLSGEWRGISGISFLGVHGTFVSNPKGPRLNDLSVIPSPYLEGVFDPLMKANPNAQWLILWETNRGCPFSCTFCDWGSAVQSRVVTFPLDRLFTEVEWFAERKIEFVFCCDANFGILKRDLDIARYVDETKRKYRYPHALSVQNTKNSTERAYQVQKILADGGLNKGVTISLQSTDPETLRSVKRQNISSESFEELQRRFTRDDIETYTDMILGLPGESYDSFADGVNSIIGNGQHNRIQFNNLSILPNAEMGDEEYQRKYGMVTVETKIVNIHGALDENEDGIYETQQLVVATKSMPKAVWRRTRAFAWMTAFLHFDKTFQIPLVVLHETCSVSYRELIEVFSEEQPERYPIISEVRRFFLEKAEDIQNGGPEYCQAKEWLNIWWPADEYVLIKLVRENKLDAFYDEAERVLCGFLRERFIEIPPPVVRESILLNKSLLKLPFEAKDLELELSYNLWEFYTGAVRGEQIPLEEGRNVYHIDRTGERWSTWDEWLRRVIWYGNKKGAYLYGSSRVEPQIAGHF